MYRPTYGPTLFVRANKYRPKVRHSFYWFTRKGRIPLVYPVESQSIAWSQTGLSVSYTGRTGVECYRKRVVWGSKAGRRSILFVSNFTLKLNK